MNLVIIPSDRIIGIGTTILSGIGTDMSWIPSDVHAVHWDGSSGEIEYNDGKANLDITSIGIYSQAETTLNNEIQRRKDLDDEIYRTSLEKYDAILDSIVNANKKGQPVLVGTTSIEKSEYLSKLLKNKKIKHNVLNAKYHEKESEIIADAGKYGSVTIATNMAGRGTDIQLGGSNGSEEEKDKSLNSGCLFVIGTERHESRRVDNQLRGRAGRQGDPGKSKFY